MHEFEASRASVDTVGRDDTIPRWLWKDGPIAAAHALTHEEDGTLQALDSLLHELSERYATATAVASGGSTPRRRPPPPSAERRTWSEREALVALALRRVRLGGVLEAAAVRRWNTYASPSARRGSASLGGWDGSDVPEGTSSRARSRTRARRLVLTTDAEYMFDAYAAAVWTTCHAAYLSLAADERQEPSPPSLHIVSNQSCEYRLANLLDGHVLTSEWASPRHAGPMQGLLVRCVNAASRGWASTLSGILKKHAGVRYAIVDAIVVCVTGLHPCLAPGDRPSSSFRLSSDRLVRLALAGDAGVELMCRHPSIVKEATRRMLCGVVSNDIALRNAALRVGNPVGRLVAPPGDVPSPGMLESMARLAHVGADLVRATAPTDGVDRVREILRRALVACEGVQLPDGVGGIPQWTGRSKQRPSPPRLVAFAGECFATTFRVVFLPFWMRATSCGSRPHRLDEVQHRALHEASAAVRACAATGVNEEMRIHRLVLRDPAAALASVAEAAACVGVPLETPNAANATFDRFGAAACGRLLVYARMAWLCEQIVVVDLGRRTRYLHLAAISWRYLGADESCVDEVTGTVSQLEERVRQLPSHITHLCVCAECRRVANCTPETRKRIRQDETFLETGVSSVTVARDPTGNEAPELYCSKRSSAALRTAIVASAAASHRRVDEDVVRQTGRLQGDRADDSQTSTDGAMAAMAHDGGVASRMRRDCKRAFEQRRKAEACGETPLLLVQLVGRTVRIYGSWYSLCSFCASVLRVLPHNRIDAEIACLHCQETLQSASTTSQSHRGAPSTGSSACEGPTCRFCDRVAPLRGRKYTTYHSPNDVAGVNRRRPSALRTTSWCPTHNRMWMRDALMVMTTPQILAHLVMRARPVATDAHTMPRAPAAPSRSDDATRPEDATQPECKECEEM